MNRKVLGFLLAALVLPVMAQREARGTFGNPEVWDWAPSRTYHVENYRLVLHFDEPKGEVFGDETVTLVPFASDFQRFYLDSSELTIDSVESLHAGGAKTRVRFQSAADRLWITLDQSHARGAAVRVEIVYHGFPRTGLFFINPNPDYPDRPREVWSQGESEFNHFWFPCWDHPDDKATSETITTVPADQVVVSNGRLASVTHGGGQATYDWIESVPHSSYLISIAAGPWRKVHQSYGGKAVDIYVPRSSSPQTALAAFGLTPDAIGFYSQVFGVEYPYEKYAQTAVRNFTAGGMENISATTRTDLALESDRAEADFPSWPLMAHELAHQWFGDLVTTRDWSNLWLNEGFANFIGDLYAQHHEGNDAYRFAIGGEQAAARAEDQNRYRRPIVDRHYSYPEQMFDSTTYAKGAAVLDMLRYVLDGSSAALRPASQAEPLFQALRAYLQAHRAGNVGTHDLAEAIRRTTGRDLDWFFHEWVFRAGYPEYRVSARYDAARRVESVSIRQTQTLDAQTPIFTMPIELAFHGAEGQAFTTVVRDDQAAQTFEVPLAFAPAWVAVDPHDFVYKTLDYQPPLEELAAQAEHDPAMMSRLWATRQLGRRGAAAAPALAAVLEHDGFPPVRAAAARSLGLTPGAGAQAALEGALRQPDARVRAAAVQALAPRVKEAAVFSQLARALQDDPSYRVEAAAARALGGSENPEAFTLLAAAIEQRPEIHVWASLIAALAERHDPRAAGLLLAQAAPGVPDPLRVAALAGLPRQRQALLRGDRARLESIIGAALGDPFPDLREAGEHAAAALQLTRFRAFIATQAANAAEPQEREEAAADLKLYEKGT